MPRFTPRSEFGYVRIVKTLDDDLLQTATQRLVAEFQPEQIWMFGSHAWGAPGEDSDVDLMVIVPSGDERSIKRMRSAHCCLRGIGFAKDVLVPTRAQVDRYEHLRASLFHQVLANGRKLHGWGHHGIRPRLADAREPRRAGGESPGNGRQFTPRCGDLPLTASCGESGQGMAAIEG